MKKRSIIPLVQTLSIAIFIISCDKKQVKPLLINNSQSNIYYKISYNKDLKESDVNYIPAVSYMKIKIHDSIGAMFMWKGDNWEYMVKKYSPDNRLHIFCFI